MDSAPIKSHKVEFNVDDISCTACHREINISKPGSVSQHPILQVLICKKCYKWYTSGEIEKGEDGADLQCRWCGDGGDVFCCNNCSNVFCQDCIKTNLGKEELKVVESTDKWCCYVCDGSPLSGLVEKCEKLKKSLSEGDRVVVNDEDEDFLPPRSSNFELLDLLDVNDMKLELPKRGSILENMKNFELCVSALAPVSRTLSNSLSYAFSQVKKLDLSDKALAVNKMEEICSKINLNFSNLLIAFMKAKSSVSNPTVNSKKSTTKKENSLKNGTRRESKGRCAENGDSSSGENCEGQPDAEIEKVVENPRIKLTISKKSLNVTVNHDDDPVIEADEQPNEGGEDAEEDGNENESGSGSESEKEECAESESSSGDEYNPKKDIREEKELSRLRRRDKMKHHKNKAAKRSLQKIKEKLRLKKLKVQLEKSKKGSKNDDIAKNEGDEDDDDDEDEEKDGDGEKDGSPKKSSKEKKHRKNSKGEEEEEDGKDGKKEKDGNLKKSKEKKHRKSERDDDDEDDDEEKDGSPKKSKEKKQKKSERDDGDDDDDEEKDGSSKKSKEKKHKKNKGDGDDDHFSSRKKKFLDKKLQRFQKSKHDDGSGSENDDNDKAGDDDEDEIDKDIRDINRMLKQKFKKATSKIKRNAKGDNPDDAVKGDGSDNDCDDSLKEDGEDKTGSPAAEGDGDEKEEKQLKEPSGAQKKRRSLVSQDLFDDSSSNKGDDDGDNDKEDQDVDNDELNDGDGGDDDDDIEMKGDGFNSTNVDENQFQLDEDMEDDDEQCGDGGDDDADGDDLNDSIIDKVIEHCGSKKNKYGEKKKLFSSESKGGRSKSDAEEEAGSVDSSERKSKKRKRDRLLAASLLSSDDDDQFASDKNDGKKKKRGGGTKGEDGDEVVQKKKRSRKKKGNDDDDDEDEEGLKALLNESDEDGRKKKRRRIKVESSSDDNKKSDDNDDSSGDDFQSPSSGKKRKKIHKIITTKKLSKQTIDAAKAEEERRKRIEERQKLFNQVIVEDSSSPTKCPITTKLVLEIDPETQEPLIEVHKKVICKLKPHQVEAVKFMWNCCIESLEMLKKEEGSGCILAHCMGLGKTLSVISFVHTMLRHKKLTKLTTCLVLTPLNTILNWESEFDRWLKGAQPLDVYEMSTVKDNWSRSEVIKSWKEGGGILIMGYDMFRTLSQLTRVKNKKQKTIITEGLLDPGPDIVVCDEGHILKNDATGLSKACNKIKTLRRIVLTGTPLQNNLVEYHCMVTFVKPSLLGTRKEFLNRFVNPITNGQCSDSTPRDVKIMKNRAHVLHETLSGCVQRKDYSALTKFLLPKNEYVISIRLSKVQVELYQAYLNRTNSKDPMLGPIRGSRIFTDYQNLMKIWTHPWVLKLDEIRQENRRMYKDDADSFIDDSDEESILDTEESGQDAPSGSEDDWKPRRKTRSSAVPGKNTEAAPKKPKKKAKLTASSNEDENDEEKEEGKEVVSGWKSKSRRGEVDPDDIKEEEKEEGDKDDKISCEWWADYLKSEDEYDVSISGKLILLAEILKLCESIGDKVLLFSQSLLSLDLIERFLSHWDKHISDDPDKQMAGTQGWDKGVDYIRMDGSTSAQNRKDWTEMFNDETNLKVRLFLISTKAGSLGINLVAANRVIIFDASWNPTHDVQSIFRVYRFGQTKPVYVYRFLAQGTMEEKIYERQVLKQSLAQRVIDEHQIERHFTSADLRELYTFKPDVYDPSNENPTPKLPQDRLLAELLTDHEQWIVQYHEHDSLLENRPEEELTEDERKAAWEEYEMEKKGLLIRQQNNVFASNINLMGTVPGDMYSSNTYIAEVQKFIHSLYLQNPGMTQEELNEKAKLFMHYQMTQQQRNYIQAQQRERDRLMRIHEESLARQRMAKLQNMGPITIDEELPQPSASNSKP